MCNTRLLVVDDDADIQREIRSHLRANGFDVELADSGLSALECVGVREPDLVLLDIGLPGMDGLEVCRRIREWSSVPVICVSGHDAVQTKTTALKLGADDYITKPFHAGELIARIHAVLRRSDGTQTPSRPTLQLGGLTIDLVHQQVAQDGRPIHLTATEFALLRELATHADRVLTYEHLLRAVWGAADGDSHLVQVHVCQLRRKIQPSPGSPRYIQAMPGVGYILHSTDD